MEKFTKTGLCATMLSLASMLPDAGATENLKQFDLLFAREKNLPNENIRASIKQALKMAEDAIKREIYGILPAMAFKIAVEGRKEGMVAIYGVNKLHPFLLPALQISPEAKEYVSFVLIEFKDFTIQKAGGAAYGDPVYVFSFECKITLVLKNDTSVIASDWLSIKKNTTKSEIEDILRLRYPYLFDQKDNSYDSL